jgi:prevent-host-death family protein
MTTASATEVKGRFGEYIERARQEPVAVHKTGRKYIVMVNADDFERLQALEDAWWARKAREAEEGGFVESARVAELLRRLAESE